MTQITDTKALLRMATKVNQAAKLLEDARVIGQLSDDKEVYFLSLLVSGVRDAVGPLGIHLESIGRRNG